MHSSPPISSPWWKGARGEGYVAGQVVLFVLVLLGPRNPPGWPPWSGVPAVLAAVAGPLLAIAGGWLAVAGAAGLGRHLSPLPVPGRDAVLVEQGAYAQVRHPMYGGLVLLSLGWASWVHGWLSLAYVAVLFALLDRKSRREEIWLVDRFPGYADYRKRVRRMIPFVY